MRRRVFDLLASLGGLLVAVVLVIAGALLMWGASFTNSSVHNQLAEQQVYFPPAAAFAHPNGTEITVGMKPYLLKYAGQEVLTGAAGRGLRQPLHRGPPVRDALRRRLLEGEHGGPQCQARVSGSDQAGRR